MNIRNVSVLLITILLSVNLSYAQGEKDSTDLKASTDSLQAALTDVFSKMFSAKIDIDIDRSLFDQKTGNIYISEKYNAMLMMISIPQGIDKAAEQMEGERKKDGYKEISSGRYEVNGKKVLFEKGMVKKNGKKMLMDMYVVEEGENSSIFAAGLYLPKHKDLFEQKIKESISTIKVAE
jgi:hypothetical protein